MNISPKLSIFILMLALLLVNCINQKIKMQEKRKTVPSSKINPQFCISADLTCLVQTAVHTQKKPQSSIKYSSKTNVKAEKDLRKHKSYNQGKKEANANIQKQLEQVQLIEHSVPILQTKFQNLWSQLSQSEKNFSDFHDQYIEESNDTFYQNEETYNEQEEEQGLYEEEQEQEQEDEVSDTEVQSYLQNQWILMQYFGSFFSQLDINQHHNNIEDSFMKQKEHQ